MKAISPILFIIIAFIAALLAASLVFQKFIKRYDKTPTPSQPMKVCNILPEAIKNNIKKVNKDKNPINLPKFKSLLMYSNEYS